MVTGHLALEIQMNKKHSLLALFLATIFISTYVYADTKIIGHITPLESELLQKSIKFPDCPGIEIVEWRSTTGLEQQSSPNDLNIKIMNDICKISLTNFWSYVKDNNLKFVFNESPVKLTVSFMPAKLGFYGDDYRNLNDHSYRFKNREKKYYSDGSIIGIWGYTQYSPLYLYMRNDILKKNGQKNIDFAATFAHELYHVLSYHHGVFKSLPGSRADKEKMEEELANSYEAFVGYY